MGRPYKHIVSWYPILKFLIGLNNQLKNSAVWSDFYTRIEGDKEIDDFEHWFDREFETPAKPVFDKLLNGQKISYEESVVLSHFVFAMVFSITHRCLNFIRASCYSI